MQPPLLQDLIDRDLVVDSTAIGELLPHLETPRSIYIGFDPTADSLHVGHLVGLMVLRRIQLAGHRPIVLVGGGTGLIGDPSGKAGERALNPTELVQEWADRLKAQIRRFVDFDGGRNGAVLADNYEWLSKLDLISFLRDIGKHFPLGAMLAKEAVKSRMGRQDVGLSYTEFSYQLLQAYDFLELFRRHGCTMQMGGSDQWGNIAAGIDLIRRIEGATAYGLTHPLLTRSDGTKLGKTESGTVWLDPSRTSAFEMYQFWLNTADADVVKFLKYLTVLPLPRIRDLARESAATPERRAAQRVLAREVTTLVHGADTVREAEAITAALFSDEVASLTEEQLQVAFRGAPATTMTLGPEGLPLVELLIAAGLAPSKRAGRELIATGAVMLNGRRIDDVQAAVSSEQALFGRYLVVRKGKRTHHLVTLG